MLSKLGVVILLKIRDWPEYYMPFSKLIVHQQLIWHLAVNGYVLFAHLPDKEGLRVRITMKGANAIADNMEWLMERGYKVL
jgi:hypothetical protein